MTDNPEVVAQALVERAALWKATNAAIAAGTFTRDDLIAHMRVEQAIAERAPEVNLEAIFVQAVRLGLVRNADEAAALLP